MRRVALCGCLPYSTSVHTLWCSLQSTALTHGLAGALGCRVQREFYRLPRTPCLHTYACGYARTRAAPLTGLHKLASAGAGPWQRCTGRA